MDVSFNPKDELQKILGPTPTHPWAALIPQILLWCFRRFCVQKLVLFEGTLEENLCEELLDIVHTYSPNGLEMVSIEWFTPENIEQVSTPLEDYMAFFSKFCKYLDATIRVNDYDTQDILSEFLDSSMATIISGWLDEKHRCFLIFPTEGVDDDSFSEVQFSKLINALLMYSYSKKAEPVKAEPVKAEPVKAEPVKVEPVKAEPPKVAPPKVEPPKVEPKVEPKVDPPKPKSNHTLLWKMISLPGHPAKNILRQDSAQAEFERKQFQRYYQLQLLEQRAKFQKQREEAEALDREEEAAEAAAEAAAAAAAVAAAVAAARVPVPVPVPTAPVRMPSTVAQAMRYRRTHCVKGRRAKAPRVKTRRTHPTSYNKGA